MLKPTRHAMHGCTLPCRWHQLSAGGVISSGSQCRLSRGTASSTQQRCARRCERHAGTRPEAAAPQQTAQLLIRALLLPMPCHAMVTLCTSLTRATPRSPPSLPSGLRAYGRHARGDAPDRAASRGGRAGHLLWRPGAELDRPVRGHEVGKGEEGPSWMGAFGPHQPATACPLVHVLRAQSLLARLALSPMRTARDSHHTAPALPAPRRSHAAPA
jgi:hypothetical protein